MNIQQFLREQDVPFDVIAHQATYDAQRMSQAVHVSGHHVAKTVLLRLPDGAYAVAVLPAADEVDLAEAADALGVTRVELATERELSEHCTDCEVGALPPFGSLYQMLTLVDQQLSDDAEILFEGNSHNESIKMSYADFVRLEQPIVSSFCLPMTAH